MENVLYCSLRPIYIKAIMDYKLWRLWKCDYRFQVRGAFITTRESSNVDATQATMSRVGLVSQASLQVIYGRHKMQTADSWVQNAGCRLGTKCRLQTADIVDTKCRLRIKTVFRQIHDSMSFYNLSSVMQSLFCGHLRRKLVLLKFIIGPFLHIKSSYISYLCT